MATLSFHAPRQVEKRIRLAAKKRGVRVSSFLREAAEQAAVGAPISGLGRELEKLAIDSMAAVALGRIRARRERTWTEEQIDALVKDTRRRRRSPS